MKNITKKIFVGGTIALSLLTPTIMASEKIQTNNDISLLSTETKGTPELIERIEIDLTNGSKTYNYQSDILRRLFVSGGSNSSAINKMTDVKFDVEFDVDKKSGLSIPEIKNLEYVDIYNSNQTVEKVQASFELVPQNVANKGDEEIYKFLLANKHTYNSNSSNQKAFDQTFDGEQGITLALTVINDFDLIKPIVFHITWPSEYDNGSKASKTSIYSDDFEKDKVTLLYKQKHAKPNKSWGSIYSGSRIDFMTIYNEFNLDDEHFENEKFYSSMSGYFYPNQIMNSISNTSTLLNIDISQEEVEFKLDKAFESHYYNYYFDPELPTFYNVTNLSDELSEELNNDLLTNWNSSELFEIDIYTNELLQSHEDKYNSYLFESNDDFTIECKEGSMYYDGTDFYLVEKIEIAYEYSISYGDYQTVENYKNNTLEFAEFLSSGVFEQMIDSSIITLHSDKTMYFDHMLNGNTSWQFSSNKAFEIDNDAGFMASPQIILFVFSILSISGLIVVVVLLVISTNKEEKGIEIVGGWSIMRELIIDKILSNPTKFGKAKKEDLALLSDSDLILVLAQEQDAAKLILKTKKEKAENEKNFGKKSDNDIIRFEGIKKSFKDKKGIKKVHQGLTFNIKRGETVALLGANGAGKTVLMETLVRVQKQDEGKIYYNFEGENPFKEIGMQFQDADSTGNLTPREMVKFISMIYKDKVSDEQTKEMIKIYGITEYFDRKIKKLSGGQRQRVNLLLATMHNPKLMILDEFITGLDIVSVRDILEYIKQLKEKNNATLIIISHQPEEIKNLSQRVFVLKDGVIQQELLTSDIDKKYNGDFSKFLLEAI